MPCDASDGSDDRATGGETIVGAGAATGSEAAGSASGDEAGRNGAILRRVARLGSAGVGRGMETGAGAEAGGSGAGADGSYPASTARTAVELLTSHAAAAGLAAALSGSVAVVSGDIGAKLASSCDVAADAATVATGAGMGVLAASVAGTATVGVGAAGVARHT